MIHGRLVHRRTSVRGMTLTELIVVLVILVGIAALAVSAVGYVAADSREQVTQASMTTLRNVIDAKFRLNFGGPPRYMSNLLHQGAALDFNPSTQTGWSGPYVLVPGATYSLGHGLPGDPGYVHGSFTDWYCDTTDGVPDPAVLDGYGRPIVLQYPDPDENTATLTAEDILHVRLVSAGQNGMIETPYRPPFDAPLHPDCPSCFPARAQCGDDLVLYVSVADLRPR